jgi:hypothetical protein
MTDFKGVDLKFGRAKEHLAAFQVELATYFKTKPMTAIPQPKTDPRREPFAISISQSPPGSLSLVFGDFIHNVRSTLDHLVMALALDNGADPYDRTIQFPICDDPDRFFGKPNAKTGARPKIPPGGTGGNNIRALRPPEQAFIEGLQPYNGAKNSWILAELQFLDNMDKHRNIIGTKFVPSAMFATPGVEIEWVTPVPDLVDGAHFATVIYPANYTGVQVYPDFTAGIHVEHSKWPSGSNEAWSFGNAQLVPHVANIIEEAKILFA